MPDKYIKKYCNIQFERNITFYFDYIDNLIVVLFFCELLVLIRRLFGINTKARARRQYEERLMAQRGGQVRSAFTARSESASPAGLHIFNCN